MRLLQLLPLIALLAIGIMENSALADNLKNDSKNLKSDSENSKGDSYKIWLTDFKKEAISKGISAELLERAFVDFKPLADVIALDNKQPEKTKTLPEYLEIMVNENRVIEGKNKLKEYSDLLARIEEKYSVDREIIVALWGIETSYGENTGNYSVIESLATLAYEGRRSEFFRAELLNALSMIENKEIELNEMSGSWAGAMGQCQFMPSTYLAHAVDYDNDGKRDIWNNTSDIFASIANYLHAEGWKKDGEIAMPVTIPENFNVKMLDINNQKPTHYWKKLGITYSDSSPLVDNVLPSSVIMVGKDFDAVPYIVYDNYKVILKWNRSRYFATAVDLLAEELRTP